MDIIGEWEGLSLDRVLHVLKQSGVTVIVKGDVTILAKGDVLREFKFTPRIKRRMLRTLSRLFGVEFHIFFV